MISRVRSGLVTTRKSYRKGRKVNRNGRKENQKHTQNGIRRETFFATFAVHFAILAVKGFSFIIKLTA
jgi:hypothetical protein